MNIDSAVLGPWFRNVLCRPKSKNVTTKKFEKGSKAFVVVEVDDEYLLLEIGSLGTFASKESAYSSLSDLNKTYTRRKPIDGRA